MDCNDEFGRFCCSSGVQGDPKCQGKCISIFSVNDGTDDCENRSDEGAIGIFYIFL